MLTWPGQKKGESLRSYSVYVSVCVHFYLVQVAWRAATVRRWGIISSAGGTPCAGGRTGVHGNARENIPVHTTIILCFEPTRSRSVRGEGTRIIYAAPRFGGSLPTTGCCYRGNRIGVSGGAGRTAFGPAAVVRIPLTYLQLKRRW